MQIIQRFIITAVICVAVIPLFCVSDTSAADTYGVDPDHSYIIFRVKHVDIGYSYGRFNAPYGTFRIDDADPLNSFIEVAVNAGEIDTNVKKRDDHLRGADFFHVKKHPRITFKSTSVRKVDRDIYEVEGNMTLLGITRPIIAKVFQTGEGMDPWKKYRRAFETRFTIKRTEWGMDFLLSGVGDEVNLTVSVEGIRK